MGKNKGGANTKVEAAKAKKAGAQAEKDAKAAAQAEAKLAAEWNQGADKRGQRKREEEERKRQEADAKKAEKERLKAMEDETLGKQEDKKLIRQNKKTKNEPASKPWEDALLAAAPKKKAGNRNRKPMNPVGGGKVTQAQIQARKEKEEAERQSQNKNKGIQFGNADIQENRNREVDPDGDAHGLDQALDVLGVSDNGPKKHPEKRAKAAYKAFEERMMPELKEEYPGLKLSQYKQKLSDIWRKSPENPLNQESLAYNTKK